ncbi:hypothetical protein O181_042486 [Austropuccinia psidii MF-1]|uniref:Uncharacterized protein n=1 Tax=Austropuccinia psidii MF-1 TaxID=1389203 RepID=A0A9Q3DEY6_9BASI|nr:hypothetical protein [Austropuccinia psidii MF-1]
MVRMQDFENLSDEKLIFQDFRAKGRGDRPNWSRAIDADCRPRIRSTDSQSLTLPSLAAFSAQGILHLPSPHTIFILNSICSYREQQSSTHEQFDPIEFFNKRHLSG